LKSTTTKWRPPSTNSAWCSTPDPHGRQDQIYKYGVHQVAHAYGKTATFMPKPVFGDNGSGMHVPPVDLEGRQADLRRRRVCGLSETCLYYIGGIIKHAKAINAFSNPSTNSYKRLVPGYEAPVLLAYSARNRSASCRIPFGSSPKAKRVEVRFPIRPPTRTWLRSHADGRHRRHQEQDPSGQGHGQGPLRPAGQGTQEDPDRCGSLREALEALDKDRKFLTAGGVFDDDQIDAFIELKMEEVMRFEMTPHPVEFDMYYSV
jgi:glutamine synthetase